MAGQYAVLKAAIEAVIKTNGNNEITGALMQQSLLAMITSLGAYYDFVDVATPSTNPGTPDQNVMYFAATAGTYTNFGGIVVNEGEFCALCWNGSWAKKTTGAATAEQVAALGREMGILTISRLIESKNTRIEQGSINSAGKNASVSTVLRTANAISTKYGMISAPSGFEIYYVYYYSNWASDNDYTLSTRVQVDADSYVLDSTYNVCRILFRNSAHTTIVPDDFIIKLPTLELLDIPGLKNNYINVSDLFVTWLTGKYYTANSLTPQSGYGFYTNGVDVSKYKGLSLYISVNAISAASIRCCLIADASNNIIKSIEEKTDFKLNPITGRYDCVLDIPANGETAYLSIGTSSTDRVLTICKMLSNSASESAGDDIVYVNPQEGDDENDGSADHPFATFLKAQQSTGENTTIIFSGESSERINIRRKPNQKTLRIVGKPGKISRFLFGEKITSGSLVSGDVYSVSRSSFSQFALFPLYQYGVADVNTEILDVERLPMQRGREYRCDCSLMLPYNSLADLQAADGLGYYWDGNTTLYVKIAAGTSLSANPVIIPPEGSANSCIYNNNATVKVELSNIDAYFCVIDLSNSPDALVSNCSVKYGVGAAGFKYDRAVGVRFIQCEAARIFSGTKDTGDGFNAHSNTGTYSTDNPEARTTTAELIDCWSHDNNDDGFSDHERCESVIRGGLYEYNGKGGVTPSFGSHCSCYGVVSRKNSNGFYYIGSATAEEGGKYGQMLCVDCVAENNTIDAGSNYNIHGGFVNSYSNGAGNRVILIGCKSLGNTYGYYNATGNTMELIDCGEMDNTNATSGTIAKKKTTIIE